MSVIILVSSHYEYLLTNTENKCIVKVILGEYMRIGIAGYGFVGKAHYEILKFKHDVVINDPGLGYTNSFDGVDCIIVCVSTPEDSDGTCNMKNVYQVIENAPNVPIIIKSTISLEGWNLITRAFPEMKISFSPEFLRAASAIEDFMKTEHLYIGGGDTMFWHTLFSVTFENPSFKSTFSDPQELILAKYFRNAYLATKVSFFNQIHDLCMAANVNAEQVLDIVGKDARIGSSHTQVTKERGFGGHCFPKDTNAILKTAETYDVDLTLIRSAISYNDKIRKN